MQFYKIIMTIIVVGLVKACAGVEPAGSKAVRDEQHALGMVLVEHQGQKLLKLVVCTVQGGQLPEGGVLADESVCPNAFVAADGNGYYFSELQPRGVKTRMLQRGYSKLGGLLLIPLAIGTVVGWKALPLVKRLELIVPAEGRTSAKVGAAAGLIAAIVTHQHWRDHLWGEGERLTATHWDDIFRTHFTFADAKLLENPNAIRAILTTLAATLNLSVNPVLNLPR